MERKKKLCKCGCNKEGYIWSHGMLKECSYKLKKPKAIKKITEKGKEKKELKKALFPNDMSFYLSIWMERPHKCYNCDKDLGIKPLTLYFDHILEKGSPKYEHLRYEKDNICLLCWDCHGTKTNGILSEKLKKLKEDPEIYDILGKKAKRLVDGLKRVAIENEIPLQVNTRGSMFGFFFCEKEPKNFKEVGLCNFERFATFHREMLKRGFYFACSQYEAGFICTKITNKMIDDCIKAADEVMKGLE